MNEPLTMRVNDVEYVRADSVTKETFKPVLEGDFCPFVIGAIYLIRLATVYNSGRVVAASNRWVVLEDAAWIADTGRFSDALKSAEFNEVEPFPDGRVIVSVGAIVDASRISKVQRSKK